jgi:hypothetical protein
VHPRVRRQAAVRGAAGFELGFSPGGYQFDGDVLEAGMRAEGLESRDECLAGVVGGDGGFVVICVLD